jgi:uncharacterized protein (TIGR03437 family)
VAEAQPRIRTENPVLNAASYALPGLPNAGIAKGSMFVVFGSGLGPSTLQQVQAFPLPTELGGTRVTITSGGTTTQAIMVYTLDRQVAAILPSSTPAGNATLTVTYNGQTSNSVNLQVVDSAFGMFTLNQAGSGPAVLQNFVSASELPVNTVTQSARPGQTVVLWGTGLGAVSGDEAAGPLAPAQVSADVQVLVGGRPANVTYKGRSGCCAGIDQVIFEVPQGIESCYAPIVVTVGGKTSNFGSMSIGSAGGACSRQLSSVPSGGEAGYGNITLMRTKANISAAGQTISSETDSAVGGFYRYSVSQLAAAQRIEGLESITIGSCYVFTFPVSGDDTSFEDPIQPRVLNAGNISVTGPKGTKQVPYQNGAYFAQLGGGTSIPGIPNIPGMPAAEPLFLDAGAYTIQGSGGPDVGPFQVSLNVPAQLVWTNESSTNNVPRSSPLRITWSGGDPGGWVAISGTSFNNSVAGAFTCLERNNAGQFTVPAYVLQSLPASSGILPGSLVVSGNTAFTTFNATGINTGTVAAASATQKSVQYQ